MKETLGCLDEKMFSEFARMFSSLIKPGMVVLLVGELGAGKTTFVKRCAVGLGLNPDQVRSPTFSLINVYEGSIKIYHADLYRFENDLEVVMEIEETIERKDGVIFIEWADKLQNFWTGEEIKLILDFCKAGRILTIESQDERFISQLLERWSKLAKI